MRAALERWWTARTARERRLLTAAGALALAVSPLLAYQAANRFRGEGAAELAAARSLLKDAETLSYLASQAAPPVDGPVTEDRSARGVATAMAQAYGLTIERLEQVGPDRVRLTLLEADSVQLYRWIETIGRRGVVVRKAVILRTGEAGLVTGDFEVETIR